MADYRAEIDKDLLDHGAASPGPSMFTNEGREYPDFGTGIGNKELSDMGAASSGPSMFTNEGREYPDFGTGIGNKELSDMGAVSSGPAMFTNEVRDLPDFGYGPIGNAELSDMGAGMTYASKEETWGTNDEDLIHEINIIEHANWSENVEKVVPQLPAASLAQIVDMRYRKIADILRDGRYGIGKDQKQYLGEDFGMLIRMAESILASNPKGLEEIFTPELLIGANKKTDIFGVLEKCKKELDDVGVVIPLLGKEDAPVVDENGKPITAQDKLAALIALKPKKEVVEATPVVETPVETPVAEMPVETPIIEEVETPIIETPVETVSVEQPEKQDKPLSFWDRFKMNRMKSKGKGETIDETTKAM